MEGAPGSDCDEDNASSSHRRRRRRTRRSGRSVKGTEIAEIAEASDTSTCCCRSESLLVVEEKGSKSQAAPEAISASHQVKEVVKPIYYAATTSVDGNKDVLVLFKALRGNGKEVIVDNKFLRERNPLLLLDFYERNLNYDKPELQLS